MKAGNSMNPPVKKERIRIIDAIRGFSILLMVGHHLLYDLTVLCGAPEWFFTNPIFDFLHYVFAGIFILLSGVSSLYSSSNIKRGIKTLACAGIITLASYLADSAIWFGILHLLGTCMLFYGFTRRLWDRIPRSIAPVIYILGTAVCSPLTRGVFTNFRHFWMFGLIYKGFLSYDYYPLLPWVFIFLLGTWMGVYIKENKFPSWFYNIRMPVLSYIGQRTLIIYMLHQPVLYGITLATAFIIGKLH